MTRPCRPLPDLAATVAKLHAQAEPVGRLVPGEALLAGLLEGA